MRRIGTGRLVAVVLLAAAAACSSPSSSPSDPTAASPSPTTPQPAVSSPKPCADRADRPFSLAMKDFEFVPDCLVVSGTVPFHLRNHGSAKHNVTIPGTNFSVDVPPGQTVSEQRLIDAGVPPGTYRFFCRLHRAKGMTGELHVLAA